MQLTQKKRQRTDLLTVAAVAALFVVMAALLYTGHLTRQVTNMLVPVAVYIVMAVSLNLVDYIHILVPVNLLLQQIS